MTLFDYTLPPERIATHPAEPRESARLLAFDRKTGEITHEHVADIPSHVRSGDVWVFNNTKVFKARLMAEAKGGRQHEVLLLREGEEGADGTVWEALVKKIQHLKRGDRLMVGGVRMTIVRKGEEGVDVRFSCSASAVWDLCERVGQVPTPPYIKRQGVELSEYQTVYAQERGSVAAPTAGLHFHPALLEEMRAKGATVVMVTLHVGVGTFRPIRTETLEEHAMHAEWADVSAEAAETIRKAKDEGRRIVAVGTTTVRTLEGVAALYGSVQPHHGFLNLFITPGFSFQVVDALLTNFHLPRSTLLALVSAFAGREHVLAAYQKAMDLEYRFYSFGDAMLIE